MNETMTAVSSRDCSPRVLKRRQAVMALTRSRSSNGEGQPDWRATLDMLTRRKYSSVRRPCERFLVVLHAGLDGLVGMVLAVGALDPGGRFDAGNELVRFKIMLQPLKQGGRQ